MDLDRIRRQLLIEGVDAVGDMVLAEYAAGMGQEQFEQRPFSRSELDNSLADTNPFCRNVDDHSRDRPLCCARDASPEERAHAGLELLDREWLGQVIVGAQIESANTVLDGVTRGKYQDARRGTALPQPPHHLG